MESAEIILASRADRCRSLASQIVGPLSSDSAAPQTMTTLTNLNFEIPTFRTFAPNRPANMATILKRRPRNLSNLCPDLENARRLSADYKNLDILKEQIQDISVKEQIEGVDIPSDSDEADIFSRIPSPVCRKSGPKAPPPPPERRP